MLEKKLDTHAKFWISRSEVPVDVRTRSRHPDALRFLHERQGRASLTGAWVNIQANNLEITSCFWKRGICEQIIDYGDVYLA